VGRKVQVLLVLLEVGVDFEVIVELASQGVKVGVAARQFASSTLHFLYIEYTLYIQERQNQT
jgi:hypothetical protein